jgi:acyl-CoA reductase-like NAD-dependent aldehyde dehydrogenase
MRSYPLNIGGQDVEGAGWTYVLHASASLRDPDRAFDLKRALELGSDREPSEDVIARCAWGGDRENVLAMEAARAAADELGAMPFETRKAIMRDFHHAVTARADELVDVMVAEGHPRRLARWELSGVLRTCEPEILEWYEQQFESRYASDGRRFVMVRRPDGVVCINPPQNAGTSSSAFAVAALFAGNAVVVKAPRSCPFGTMFLCREVITPILDAHGAPPGALNVVSGDARRILRGWIASPYVDDVFFVGDSDTGLRLGAECVAKGKKPILELAGNDGFLVWHDADVEAAATALTECFLGSSQICMVPKYAIVHPGIADAFFDAFLELVSEIRPGYPDEPDVVLSPVLKVDRFFDFLAEAREAGCDVLTGGRRVDVEGVPSVTGAFVEPTVVRVDGLSDAKRLSCVREETFFPMIPIVVPRWEEEPGLLDAAIRFVNANEYGLRNSVWARDEGVIGELTRRIVNGGLLKVNDSHIGFVSYLATHGGTGRTGGPFGEMNYFALRTSHLQGICLGTGQPSFVDPLAEHAVALGT